MDLAVFLLEGPLVSLPAPSAADPSSPEHTSISMPTSISAAWRAFVTPSAAPRAPPSKRICDRRTAALPATAFTDKEVHVRFRYPATADPPPRLAAFAFPESIDEELLDQPRDVCFCLTLSDGSRVHGSALQMCDPDPAASDRVTVRALVLLSKWPCYDAWKTLLHTIFSRRDELWPADAPLSPSGRARFPEASLDASSPSLVTLLEQTASVLRQSGQELGWMTTHPLWLPTPLAPLFRSLRWQPAEAAYLLTCVLTDQRVLLHSEDAHRLYCSACALKALITPLETSTIFIPLLPQHLMSADEAGTLLCDCTRPYLIGCSTALLSSMGRSPSSEVVLVDLDRGQVSLVNCL
jgi:hypothetical protein